MAKYRALVSIEFDDEDLTEFGETIGIPTGKSNASETISACMDDLPLGSSWLEQFFIDGKAQMYRIGDGLEVIINEHDLGE